MSLVAVALGLFLFRLALELTAMLLGYFFFFVIPIIFINILFLLTWIVRPDFLYKDIKLFIDDRIKMRLGFFDFIDRFFFIPGYKSKNLSLHHF
jgi:hypothetical protein